MSTVIGIPAVSVQAGSVAQAVYRKMIFRIIPFFFICYVVNQLDRLNISFAKLRFMQDIGLTDMSYGIGAGLFFIGYVVFEVPSNLYLQRVGARATFIRIMMLWGLISVAMALVTTPMQLYVARFFLGAAEAGFVPGVILYLTYWFPASYRARIAALFFMAITFSGILGGPLSGWILKSFTDFGGLKSWQWLFIIEGLPAVALGLIAYFYLDDKPDDAKWLTSTEKQIVRDDLLADAKMKEIVPEGALRRAFVNPKVYIAGFVYFSIIAGNNAMTLWMPTLIKGLGVDDIFTIGLISGIPYVAGALGMYFLSRHSDQRLERRWHVALSLLATAVSYALVGNLVAHPVAAIALLAVAAAGIYTAIAIFWTIPPAYLTGKAAAGGIALVSSIGMMGGFASPIIIGWAKTMTGSIQPGFWMISAILVLGAFALLAGIPAKLLEHRKQP